MELHRKFTKDDLKNGMIVETKAGTLLLVLNDNLINNKCWVSLNHYQYDLTRMEWTNDNFRDIVKVYTTKNQQCLDDMFKNKTLIWDRSYYKEMTLEQIEEQLGYKIVIK